MGGRPAESGLRKSFKSGVGLKRYPQTALRLPAAQREPAARWCRVRRLDTTCRSAGLPDWMATAMVFRARRCADNGRAKTRLTLLPSPVGTALPAGLSMLAGKRRMTGRRGRRTIARDDEDAGGDHRAAFPISRRDTARDGETDGSAESRNAWMLPLCLPRARRDRLLVALHALAVGRLLGSIGGQWRWDRDGW